jgi:hypothetical protein
MKFFVKRNTEKLSYKIAGVEKNYNATASLVRFEDKIFSSAL